MAEKETKFVELSPVKKGCYVTSFDELSKARLQSCRANTPINPVKYPILFGDSDYYSGSLQTTWSMADRIQEGIISQIDSELAKLPKKGSPAEQKIRLGLNQERTEYSSSKFVKNLRDEISEYVTTNWDRRIYKDQAPSLSDVSNLHQLSMRDIPSVEKFLTHRVSRKSAAIVNYNARSDAHRKLGELQVSWQELPSTEHPPVNTHTRSKRLDSAPLPTIAESRLPARTEPEKKQEKKAAPVEEAAKRPSPRKFEPPKGETPKAQAPMEPMEQIKFQQAASVIPAAPKVVEMVLKPLKESIGLANPTSAELAATADRSKILIMRPQTIAGLIDTFFDKIFTKQFLERAGISSKEIFTLKKAFLGLFLQESACDAFAMNEIGDSGLGQFKKRTAEGIINANQELVQDLLQTAKDKGYQNLRTIRFYANDHVSRDPSLQIRFDGPASIAMAMIYVQNEMEAFSKRGALENGFFSYHHGRAAVENHLDSGDHHTTGHSAQKNEPDSVAVRVGKDKNGKPKFLNVPWDKYYFVRLIEKADSVLKGDSFGEFVLGAKVTKENKATAGKIVKSCLDNESDSPSCKTNYFVVDRDKVDRKHPASTYFIKAQAEIVTEGKPKNFLTRPSK